MTQPPSGAETSPQPRISEDDRIAQLQLLRSPRVGPGHLPAANGGPWHGDRSLESPARFGPK
jgi:hypothetical protein